MKTFYNKLTCPVDDLLRSKPYATALKIFYSNNEPWFDIPFGYQPYWKGGAEQIEVEHIIKTMRVN